jgi:hypothetical protein
VWRLERGRLDAMTLATIRRVCAPLDIDVDLLTRGQGAELDRLVNARHSALHESVARALARWAPGWEMAPEVSFNIWGERGVIDLLLWHPGRRSLLIIEFKTELVDHGDLISTMDRRYRLAGEIVASRGWKPVVVSSWVIVARSRTNERRIAGHRTMLRAAFPDDLRGVRTWLADPTRPIRALSMWHSPTATPLAPTLRVRRPHDH